MVMIAAKIIKNPVGDFLGGCETLENSGLSFPNMSSADRSKANWMLVAGLPISVLENLEK